LPNSAPIPTPPKALRDVDPILWQDLMQGWLVTGYEDVQAILKDHAHFSSERTRANNPIVARLTEQSDPSLMRRTATMLSIDPPDHTRMRNSSTRPSRPASSSASGRISRRSPTP
jgi:cytochrome P450